MATVLNIKDIRKCITTDLKKVGNPVYLVGKETEKEMGGSEYYNIVVKNGGIVPKTDTKILKKCIKGILTAIEKKYIDSCHDISEGGIGVCISEMAIGGDNGVEINISHLGDGLRSDFKLFSESNTRWIVEVKVDKQKEFEKLLIQKNTPFIQLGKIKGKKLLIKDKNEELINIDISVLRKIWKNAIWNIMG